MLAVIMAVSGSANAQGKPNILIIITDQLSAESMSFNLGDKYLKTPNMDYLAEHGITFTNAYCANPLCVPSRSSMFTGRYPHEFPSMGTIFKNAGYETGYVGKWHLPYDRNISDSHGFTYLPEKKGNGTDSISPALADKFLKMKLTLCN